MVGTWLGEIRSCSCLAVLPDTAWVLLNKIYQPFFTSLYGTATPARPCHSNLFLDPLPSRLNTCLKLNLILNSIEHTT